MVMNLTLLVLKTPALDRTVAFYRLLGLSFQQEQHGRGPVHFSTTLDQTTLEIYPLGKTQTVDATTRLGFTVNDLSAVIDAIQLDGGTVVSQPSAVPMSMRAVEKLPPGTRY